MTEGMHMDLSKLLLPAILFVLTLGFGLWLSLMGRPYNGLLFNIHKLLALGAVVLAGVQVYALMKAAPLAVGSTLLTAAAALGVLALFFSGAMLSMGRMEHTLALMIHRVGLALSVVVGGAAWFVLR